MSNITVESLLPMTNPQDGGWKFLGGLIDKEDIQEGPIDNVYVLLQKYQAFSLKKEVVGFYGAIGIKISPNNSERLQLVLWPHMPPLNTKDGYLSAGEPKPVFDIVWGFEEMEGVLKLNSVRTRIHTISIHSKALAYSFKILSRAQELWPVEVLTS